MYTLLNNLKLPDIPTGTTGQPVLIAKNAAPFFTFAFFTIIIHLENRKRSLWYRKT